MDNAPIRNQAMGSDWKKGLDASIACGIAAPAADALSSAVIISLGAASSITADFAAMFLDPVPLSNPNNVNIPPLRQLS